MTKQFIRVLPFYTQPIIGDPDLEVPAPVALWKCGRNICEAEREDSRCDDSEGIYYTVADDPAGYYCPRHWYEVHAGPDPAARLIDMTPEQHVRERREHKERLRKDWAVVSERIDSSARILAREGLQDAAGKLWQAHGYVRSSIDSL